jgi:hypothetical protein
MVRYFYAWTPLFIVGTVVLLSLPWLGVIALMLVALVLLVALAELAYAIAGALRVLSGAVSHPWHRRSEARQALTPARSPAGSDQRPTHLVPTGATLLLARQPSERDG